jgi:23S rRNA (uridine2552-2'-O)-methyltransferase
MSPHYQSQDSYFLKAKKEGFKSRAAFKLMEIHKKFQIFKKGQRVVDLGAAPGGWSQVALKQVGAQGKVIAVDLQKLDLPQTIDCIQGDINDALIQSQIIEITKGPVDIVLSDMAPATTGVKFRDHMRSVELARTALQFCCAWATGRSPLLKAGGAFVVKIFPGEDLDIFKKEMKKSFKQFNQCVPSASRKTSNEVYLVGRGFLKPPNDQQKR